MENHKKSFLGRENVVRDERRGRFRVD